MPGEGAMLLGPAERAGAPRRRLILVTAGSGAVAALMERIASAVEGGVDVVQLRDKAAGAEELAALAREARARLAGRVPVLVNTHWRVAAVGDADGVHLPEDFAALEMARRELAPGALIGMSVHGAAAALRAERLGASYVTFGHVYRTSTHPDVPPRGPAALRFVVQAVRIPVIAIGGIDAGSVDEVIGAGAAGIAVVSAILEARDARAAARRLREALDWAAPRR